MNDENRRRIQVAAAHKESAEFALDQADVDLAQAAAAALEQGAKIEAVAAVAEVPVSEILSVIENSEGHVPSNLVDS
jgi:hypothetical protein